MATWFPSALANAFGSVSGGGAPNIDFLSDDIRVALVTSSYTPSLAHDFWDDVVSNEVSGTGYTANGQALSSKALAVTAANSWGIQWATGTAYRVGDLVRPTSGNGFVYRCIAAGTSHASTEPTWPTTVGNNVTDNGVTWQCEGRYVVWFDAADPSWSGTTLSSVRYAVYYDRTPGSDAARPLIAYEDFGSNQQTTNGTFAITLPASGLIYIVVP